MALYVHIADERDSRSIRRAGLALPKARMQRYETQSYKFGVFAMPVIESFMLSLQWVRELKRRGHRTPVGVYFRIDDNEAVWAGRFGRPKQSVSAAQALAMLRSEQMLGFEVVIPRSISPSEIQYIRAVPQVGWRYFPEAKGARPRCGCKFCVGSEIKGRRLRERREQ